MRWNVSWTVALLLVASRAHADDTWSTPFAGVRHLHRVTGSQDIHAMVVDLCAAGVSVRATRPAETYVTVPDWAARVGVQLAVNGNFYTPGRPSEIDGFIVGDGMAWGGPDHGYTGPAAFGAHRAEVIRHDDTAGPQPWMTQAVSGHPTVLIEGAVQPTTSDTTLCPRNPRTAVGLSRDRATLYLVAVDGRATGRVGMTCGELGTLMRDLGAWNAVNLDGGGSTVLWQQGAGVLNRPSDGSLRRAVSHLGVYARGSGEAAQCPMRCAPHCEGSVMVDAFCARGDCGAFGSRCVNDSLGLRCAFYACPDRGAAAICLDATRTARCADGALSPGDDCAATGGTCTADAMGARCVNRACPVAGDARVCLDGRVLATCRAGAVTERGDCGAFGARCVNDALGARCAFFACPDRGDADVCFVGDHLGHCHDGALPQQVDCAASGGRCVVTDGVGRCAFAACPATGEADVCVDDRHTGHCRNGVLASQGDCGAFGAGCVHDVLGPRCVFFACPARGERDTCFVDTHRGHCRDGALVTQSDCAPTGVCNLAGDTARCVSPRCVTSPTVAPVAHDACGDTVGRIVRCDASGAARDEDCPAGQQCAQLEGAVRCVPAVCPRAGVAQACLDGRRLAQCVEGAVTGAIDCASQGGQCVVDHCVAPDDAGAPADAPDVATDDVAAPVDAPRIDAASSDDVGLRGGCGCRAGAGAPRGIVAAAAALAAVSRRRRRRRGGTVAAGVNARRELWY